MTDALALSAKLDLASGQTQAKLKELPATLGE